VKTFASCGSNHFFHVFAPDFDASAADTGNDSYFGLSFGWLTGSILPDAGCVFIAGRTVIFGYFGVKRAISSDRIAIK
jgi:hypothetical protein